MVLTPRQFEFGLLAAALLFLSGCQGGEVRKSHYPDGQLKSRKHFRTDGNGDEIPHGTFTDYRPDGSKMLTGKHVNGKPAGTWRRYFENGSIAREWSYRDGKLDGASTDWFPEGPRQHVVHYDRGIKDGVETVWFATGGKQWEGVFKDGALVSYKTFNVDGDLIEAYDHHRGQMEPEAASMWEKQESDEATRSPSQDR